jgi:hypothetical protein
MTRGLESPGLYIPAPIQLQNSFRMLQCLEGPIGLPGRSAARTHPVVVLVGPTTGPAPLRLLAAEANSSVRAAAMVAGSLVRWPALQAAMESVSVSIVVTSMEVVVQAVLAAALLAESVVHNEVLLVVPRVSLQEASEPGLVKEVESCLRDYR